VIAYRRSPAATADLVDIWLYIAGHNPVAADALLVRIDQACQLLPETQILVGLCLSGYRTFDLEQ